MNKKFYNAAIIGCGRIGSEFDDDPKRIVISTHAGAYDRHPEVNLAAVADIDEVKLKKCQRRWNIPNSYTDIRDMFSKEQIDVLSICTWSSTHLEVFKEAVKNGVKAVFCEKPMAATLKEADKMLSIAEDNNIVFIVDHQRRFSEMHNAIRNFILSGGLGQIQHAVFFYGAGIANTGSHMLDLLRFFMGDVEWVSGIYSRIPNTNHEDSNIDGILNFKNGCVCSVHACDVREYLIFELDIIGNKGRIKVTNSGYKFEYYSVGDSEYFSGYKELQASQSPFGEHFSNDNMVNGVKHIINCLNKVEEPISSAIDGRASLELICALNESAAREGEKTYLPLKNRDILIKSK